MSEKQLLIESGSELSIRRQCELLGISRTSYYYTPVGESPENLALMRAIDELYLSYPFFGARRILAHLPEEYKAVNIKRLRRLMRLMGIEISMDSKGRALDNIFIERFWRSLKYECIYLHSWADGKQLNKGLKEYIHFYNCLRKHQSLNYLTPEQVYFKRS